MTIAGPTVGELRCLAGMLRKAAHKNVAQHFICGFMWTIWPEWYDRYFRAWRWQEKQIEQIRRRGASGKRGSK